MSRNPNFNSMEFLPLEDFNSSFPDFSFSMEDFEILERANLVIFKIENGQRFVHLGSFMELLSLHIVRKAPDI